jgi:hypothetical protein
MIKLCINNILNVLSRNDINYELTSVPWSSKHETVGIFIPLSGTGEDNPRMKKERDLLPWILGGLSATAVAVAFTAISTNRTASQNAPPAALVASQPLASSAAPASPAPATVAPESAPVSAPVSEPDPAQAPAPAPMQAALQPEASGGQIWVCTTKGVKTFSNNPCGENSTLLDVGPINTMNATPSNRYPRGYEREPRYAPAYSDQAPSEDYSEQYGSETGANSYTIVQGLAFVPRRRAEHPHRPPYHRQNSMPMRRY